MNDTVFDAAWCRRRRVRNLNLRGLLVDREIGARPAGTSFLLGARHLQQCVVPSRTIPDIDRPSLFLRRFTPDGRYLIAFSSSQHDVLIFDYRGVQETNNPRHRARDLFQRVFRLRSTVTVVDAHQDGTGAAQLSRDCVLLTHDSRHLLVVTISPCAEHAVPLYEMYRNNESLTNHSSLALENYSFVTIDVQKGEISDSFPLRCDKVFPGQGVYLLDRLFAVLSVQHQTIYLNQIESETGMMMPVHQIGRFIFDDDRMHLPVNANFYREKFLGGLKQRLLAFIWRQFANRDERRFFNMWEYFRSMRIWRMQLLDSDRILLRFVTEQTLLTRNDLHLQPCLFAIFDWKTTDVLAVFDWHSSAFFSLYESCAEQFRHPDLPQTFPTTFSHCAAALDTHRRLKRSLTAARGGSVGETQRRVLAHLPFAPTSVLSPYLDPAMFSYDDRLCRQLDRGVVPTDAPLRVFCRRAYSRLAYAINWPTTNRIAQASLVFHPYDPLIIVCDRARPDTPLSLHVPPTVEEDL